MTFTQGSIQGVEVRPLQTYTDHRGWLAEVFRHDELPAEFHPAMAYLSLTLPGVLRGPHEHVEQADLFAGAGPGDFKMTLWDNRPDSPSYGRRMELDLGAQAPASVLVPKGVVHCYRCVSPEAGLMFNLPNRLYRGQGKAEPVDEIRHEDDPANPFVLDERARHRGDR